MEKRIYRMPIMALERFVPNEYIAACYHVECKTDAANDTYHYIYLDTNGNGYLDRNDTQVYHSSFHGCGIKHHSVISESGLKLNGFVSTEDKYTSWGNKITSVYVWEQETVDHGNIHVCYNPTSADYIADRPNAS